MIATAMRCSQRRTHFIGDCIKTWIATALRASQ
jgi:hypothetical protein